jgi:hypothetical protein
MSRTIEAVSKHTGASCEKDSDRAKSQMMKAVRIHKYGGPEILQYEGAPRRKPKPGELSQSETELPQGYLIVYSATDPFDDGGVPYYAHSAYSIYTADGRFFKHVENHISLSDEVSSLVTLPTGSYTIETRSESHGYVRVPIVITTGRRRVVDPDREQTVTQKLFARTKHSRHLADG